MTSHLVGGLLVPLLVVASAIAFAAYRPLRERQKRLPPVSLGRAVLATNLARSRHRLR